MTRAAGHAGPAGQRQQLVVCAPGRAAHRVAQGLQREVGAVGGLGRLRGRVHQRRERALVRHGALVAREGALQPRDRPERLPARVAARLRACPRRALRGGWTAAFVPGWRRHRKPRRTRAWEACCARHIARPCAPPKPQNMQAKGAPRPPPAHHDSHSHGAHACTAHWPPSAPCKGASSAGPPPSPRGAAPEPKRHRDAGQVGSAAAGRNLRSPALACACTIAWCAARVGAYSAASRARAAAAAWPSAAAAAAAACCRLGARRPGSAGAGGALRACAAARGAGQGTQRAWRCTGPARSRCAQRRTHAGGPRCAGCRGRPSPVAQLRKSATLSP